MWNSPPSSSSSSQLQDAEAALAEIKDRHKDIQNLEKSLLVRVEC
jgi:t-SNARE complex subunit (syntaxin)